jgi:hypothetical protein
MSPKLSSNVLVSLSTQSGRGTRASLCSLHHARPAEHSTCVRYFVRCWCGRRRPYGLNEPNCAGLCRPGASGSASSACAWCSGQWHCARLRVSIAKHRMLSKHRCQSIECFFAESQSSADRGLFIKPRRGWSCSRRFANGNCGCSLSSWP